MFSLATEHLVEQIDAEELIPCKTMLFASNLQVLSIVERDASGKYFVTDYSINDLMTTGDEYEKNKDTWKIQSICGLRGNNSVKITRSLKLELANFFDFDLEHTKSVSWNADFGECELEKVDAKCFTEHLRSKKLDIRHPLIIECIDNSHWYKAKPALGVVTGILKSTTETVLTVTSEPKGKGKVKGKIPQEKGNLKTNTKTDANNGSEAPGYTGGVEVSGEMKGCHTVIIPANKPLAYQLKELVINTRDGTIEKMSKKGGLSRRRPTGSNPTSPDAAEVGTAMWYAGQSGAAAENPPNQPMGEGQSGAAAENPPNQPMGEDVRMRRLLVKNPTDDSQKKQIKRPHTMQM